PGYRRHQPNMVMAVESEKDLEQLIGMYRAGVPDLDIRIQHLVAEGDGVVTRVICKGTHTGELAGSMSGPLEPALETLSMREFATPVRRIARRCPSVAGRPATRYSRPRARSQPRIQRRHGTVERIPEHQRSLRAHAASFERR